MTYQPTDPGDRGHGIGKGFYESYVEETSRELLFKAAQKLILAREKAGETDRKLFSARYVETVVDGDMSKVPSSRIFFVRPAQGIVPFPIVDALGGVSDVDEFEVEIPEFFEGVMPQAVFVSILKDGQKIYQAISERQMITFDPTKEKVKIDFHNEEVLLEKVPADDTSDDIDPSLVPELKDVPEGELIERSGFLNLYTDLINYYLLASRPKYREASA